MNVKKLLVTGTLVSMIAASIGLRAAAGASTGNRDTVGTDRIRTDPKGA